MRRVYYDHEPAYARIRSAGGRGWDDLPGRRGDAASDSYAALIAFLDSPWRPRGGRAIDLGCGGGQGSRWLARAGFDVVGVDFSPTAIAMARENAARWRVQARFEVADCLHLADLGDATFDLAVDNHTLHCLIGVDRGRFWREAARVLKPGGVLFSESMTAEGSPDFQALGVDPSTRVDAHHARYWAHWSELVAEAAAAGLTPVAHQRRPQPDRPDPGLTIASVWRRGPTPGP